MDELLQLVLEANDDTSLSAATERFYVLGNGLRKEFGAILKAFKVDGLVVSCTDAPKGDKDFLRAVVVNMAHFSKLEVGYAHTCSELEAIALAAQRDNLDPEKIGIVDARSCAKLARAIVKANKEGGKTPVASKAPKAPTPASGPSSPVFADAGALAEANGAVELKEADVLRMKVASLEAKLAAQEANAVAPTPVQKVQSPVEMEFSPAQERVGPDLCVVVKGLAPERRGFVYEMDKFVAVCENVKILDKKLPRSALVEAKRSGSAVFLQFVDREARDEFIKRFKMERRGQGPPFCHVKSAAVEEVTVAIARAGDALDRAFNGPQHPPKRARHA